MEAACGWSEAINIVQRESAYSSASSSRIELRTFEDAIVRPGS